MSDTKHTNRNVICVSFRESELWLYNKLKTFSCPSGTIKDILKEHFTNNKEVNNNTYIENTNTDSKLNLIDF